MYGIRELMVPAPMQISLKNFTMRLFKNCRQKILRCSFAHRPPSAKKIDFSNELDGDLNKYAAIIRNIAKYNNCQLIDLRKLFLDYNLANNKDNKDRGVLTVDMVHLNDAGNNAVAK